MQEVHLDFCLAQLPLNNQNYKVIRLRPSPFCAVYGSGIRPPSRKKLSARDLKDVPLLVSRRRDSGGSYNFLMRSFQTEGIVPNILLDTQDSRILLELLENGLHAVAICPQSEVPASSPLETRLLNFGDLKTLPVIIVLQQAYLSHAAFSVLRFLYEKYRDPEDKKDYLSLLFEED